MATTGPKAFKEALAMTQEPVADPIEIPKLEKIELNEDAKTMESG